jgi:hypothetical protein
MFPALSARLLGRTKAIQADEEVIPRGEKASQPRRKVPVNREISAPTASRGLVSPPRGKVVIPKGCLASPSERETKTGGCERIG